MSRKLTGPERAAVLLMNLGEDIAAKVLVNLDDREIQNIGNYMSALGDVDMSVMDDINKEFYDMVESGTGGLGIAGRKSDGSYTSPGNSGTGCAQRDPRA